jgi:hypothetical protein
VKRVFEAYTAYSDGVLPLYKLPDITRALGLPLPPGFLEDPARVRDIDPAGEGLVNRKEFIDWWKRYAVQHIKAADAERLASAAAEGDKAASREQRRAPGGGGASLTDDETATTRTDTGDTASVGTLAQLHILESQVRL